MTDWKSHFRSGWAALKRGTGRGLAVLAMGGMFVTTAAADDVVFSNKARFRIPYQLDSAEIQRLKASEIQLHVSTDGGTQWRLVDSVPPVEGKFTFEAARDGEYWFSVRTLGENGRHHPTGPLTPGLKVFVDTVPPTLDLQVSQTTAGQVHLRWSAADDHLNADSLILEYRNGSDNWERVHVIPSAAGETMWSVPNGGSIAVRGKVQDQAENQVIQQVEAAVTGTSPAAPIGRKPIAGGQPAVEPPATATPLAQQPGTQGPLPQVPPTSKELPVINPNGNDYSQFISQQGSPQPPVKGMPWETAKEQPSVASPPAATPPLAQPAATPTLAPTLQPQPSSTPIRRVNSTNFQIGYALDDVGPSGVSSVDLFLTEDNGQKWFHFGADADGVSPFEVTVPQDGTYGFAIRVRSGVGLAQSPPQPGDLPEVVVAVDREPPQVKLMPLKQGQGQLPSQLLIEWTMSDADLADRPVSLYYASRPTGPWQPITGWEPNTGNFLWTFGPDAPKQVYIRLDARDTAGNIARVESQEPLLIDLSRPTARILDVESISVRH